MRIHGVPPAEADMQRHFGAFDARGPERVEQCRGEVQASGRRRDRATMLRIDGLISIPIGQLIVALDVRGQRHVAVHFHGVLHRATAYDTLRHKRLMQRTTVGGDAPTTAQPARYEFPEMAAE